MTTHSANLGLRGCIKCGSSAECDILLQCSQISGFGVDALWDFRPKQEPALRRPNNCFSREILFDDFVSEFPTLPVQRFEKFQVTLKVRILQVFPKRYFAHRCGMHILLALEKGKPICIRSREANSNSNPGGNGF